ncbi:MAG: aspartyl/asparaginyl beta-hydroxylase domain-containing protein [Bacteroidia bacterium]|nr:aspartyl/asparaginyl beta-hydroxylase domain-containing protein [Bacteroidia bacterium]
MSGEFTEKNPKYFYDAEEFPELLIFEKHAESIKNEFLNVKNNQSGFWLDTFPHYVDKNSKNTWKVFSFRFFGIDNPINHALCKVTSSLLQSNPNIISADFSYLPAQTRILPHKGFTKMVLRVHLGLIIPDGDIGIRVGHEVKQWKAGKLLILDDSFEHEAWNNTNQDRVVLMFDIVNPRWDYSAEQICRYKIENMQDNYMLQLMPKEKWIECFNKKEFDMQYLSERMRMK